MFPKVVGAQVKTVNNETSDMTIVFPSSWTVSARVGDNDTVYTDNHDNTITPTRDRQQQLDKKTLVSPIILHNVAARLNETH